LWRESDGTVSKNNSAFFDDGGKAANNILKTVSYCIINTPILALSHAAT